MPRLTITPPGASPQAYQFDLTRESVTIGRGKENDVVIDCPSTSINHAVMERISGGYWVRDLGSTNATKHDGKAFKRITLKNGYALKLGDVKFDFALSEEELEELSEEEPEEDQEDIPKEDHVPVASSPAAASAAPLASVNAGLSFPMTMLLILVACGAFFVGMSIRYSKDHPGRSMLKDIINGKPAAEQQANSAASEEGK